MTLPEALAPSILPWTEHVRFADSVMAGEPVSADVCVRESESERAALVAMAGTIWLFWTLVGPTAAHMLTVPESPIYVSTGNTALLSAWLTFSPRVPDYFQLRWSVVTDGYLMLMLQADSCMAETGTQHWRDSCRINIEKTERYRHRAELSSEDASLVLQNVSAEDSGNYSVTVLALDLMLSAKINLIVTDVPPRSSISTNQSENLSSRPVLASPSRMAANDRDYKVSNAIQLSLAGVILCLLGLIIAEYISFTYCKERGMEAKNEGEITERYQDGSESTFGYSDIPLPGNILLLLEMPITEDLNGLYYNSGY